MKFSVLLVPALAVLFAAGCAQEEHHARYDETISPVYSSGRMRDYNEPVRTVASAHYSMQVNGNAAATVSSSRPDSSVVSLVRESLERNVEIAPMVPNIQVHANRGAVVLNGWVQSAEQKRQIGAITRDVPGVVAVNNQLVPLVDPTARQPAMVDQPANPLLNQSSTDQANNTNGLNPTSLPNGADKVYQQGKSGQGAQSENTNGNQVP
jgi:hypothetical protein